MLTTHYFVREMATLMSCCWSYPSGGATNDAVRREVKQTWQTKVDVSSSHCFVMYCLPVLLCVYCRPTLLRIQTVRVCAQGALALPFTLCCVLTVT